MRIGILTFHCAHNYGAVLQCYALQTFLEQRGHDVRVIDYRPKAITIVYKLLTKKRIIRKNVFRVVKYLSLLFWRIKRYDKFEEFIKNKLHLAPINTIMEIPYDIIIIGSDQVWNYNLTNGFDKYYWGNFPHPARTRIVSYAASMQDSWPEKLSFEIIRNLDNFDYISVREISLAERLTKLTNGRKIYQVVDPTLLLGKEKWMSIAIKPNISKPYLLLFQVEGRNKKTEKIADTLSNIKNLPIIRLTTSVDWYTSSKVRNTSPAEFVGLFMHAAFVVCSSFHGTVFSLIFNRPFVSVRMGVGKDNRVANLLLAFGLERHFIDSVDLHADYQYNLGRNRFDTITAMSKAYIKMLENE